MTSRRSFPTSHYCSQISRLLDAIKYNDKNMDLSERVDALQEVCKATKAYFNREPACEVFEMINPRRLAAVTRTISQFVVSCWSKVPRDAQIDISIYLSVINVLDDEINASPAAQMNSFWEDLFQGKEQQHSFWVLMKEHLPRLLGHYGSFCAFNIMRCTFDYFQGCWMEQHKFAGFAGAETFPLFLRRLNCLGGAVGGTIFPASEFDEQQLFVELSCVMAQISGPVAFMNDLFSYYKEFELDEVNLVSSWCTVDGISNEQALERLTDETIRACLQILNVFDKKDSKVLETIQVFIQGYVTWHICDLRYRLREVYDKAESEGVGKSFRGYHDQAVATGWVDPAEWSCDRDLSSQSPPPTCSSRPSSIQEICPSPVNRQANSGLAPKADGVTIPIVALLYRDAYEKYSKSGRTVLLPGLGFRHDVVLPHSSVKWILSHSERDLSHIEAVQEVVQLEYGLGDKRYKADQWPMALIKVEINGALEQTGLLLNAELQKACDSCFGSNATTAREVCVQPAVRHLVAQVASRFIVGLPLCREDAYISECLTFVDAMIVNGGLMGATPRILRPILAPLFSWKLHRSLARMEEFVRCLQSEMRAESDSEHAGQCPFEPPSLFRHMMDFAKRERPLESSHLGVMTRRLCFVNFASMHQTSVLFTNTLLNVVASDPEFGTLGELRDEIAQVLGPARNKSNLKWTKRHIACMTKMDSVARETLRLQSFNSRQLFRKVMRDDLDTPDGIRLPKGSYISIFAHPAQVDPAEMERAFDFVPFRFHDARLAAVQRPGSRQSGLNPSFVSTSLNYLGFGYAGNACPGRFIVDFEIKMMLTYMLDNYDISFPARYAGHRPENSWKAEAYMPPANAKLLFTRRTALD